MTAQAIGHALIWALLWAGLIRGMQAAEHVAVLVLWADVALGVFVLLMLAMLGAPARFRRPRAPRVARAVFQVSQFAMIVALVAAGYVALPVALFVVVLVLNAVREFAAGSKVSKGIE